MFLKDLIKTLAKRLHIYSYLCNILDFFKEIDLKCAWKSFKLYLANNIVTHIPVHAFRILCFKKLLNIQIGKNSFIHLGAMLNGRISIGEHTIIGRKCFLEGEITIGNNVSITAESYIISGSHDKDSSCFAYTSKPIFIDDYSWLGARSIILPGVTIGRGAITGAGSVVTCDIPTYRVYAGVPAKQIGLRKDDVTYTLHYSPYFS